MNMYSNSSTHKSELGVNAQHAAPRLATCLPPGLSRLFAEHCQQPLSPQQKPAEVTHCPRPRTLPAQAVVCFPPPGSRSSPLGPISYCATSARRAVPDTHGSQRYQPVTLPLSKKPSIDTRQRCSQWQLAQARGAVQSYRVSVFL